MTRTVLVLGCVAGCAAGAPDADPALSPATTTSVDRHASLAFTREHVTGDIYHYSALVPIGTAPSAALRLHRVVRELAPFVPRRTARAAMLLHGDFATFVTDFAPTLGAPASPAPGLAPYLAARDLDVWGVDRRWTLPGSAGDVSDFGAMGVAQELDDLRIALALASATRLAGGARDGTLALVGFSHGAQLAYTYASVEAARPSAQRVVRALVALDFYGALGPDQVDVRAFACGNSAAEYDAVAAGFVDSPNDFLISAGQNARTDPDGASGFGDLTNRDLMLFVVGQTYNFAPFAPLYHLLAPVLAGDAAVGLGETTEDAATAWLAGSPPHQSMLEGADLDALLCGTGPMPVDAPLSRIRVPLYYLGAAGGVGALGVYSTTQVSSSDVTAQVVQRLGAERIAEDFGHGDLLFAADAPTLAWQPLAAWLARH